MSQTIMIASPLEAEFVARIRAVDPAIIPSANVQLTSAFVRLINASLNQC